MFDYLAMHSLAAVSWPRMSETEPEWFVFDTSCYAFGGRTRRFAKVNVIKGNIFYCIVLNEFYWRVVAFDVHVHYIDNAFILVCA